MGWLTVYRELKKFIESEEFTKLANKESVGDVDRVITMALTELTKEKREKLGWETW